MTATRRDFPIYLDKHAPWGGAKADADIVILGVDWSAGTFAMQFRNEPGDDGDPLIALGNASAGSQGISTTYEPEVAHPLTGELTSATIIRPQIDETTLEDLDLAADPARPAKLHYDILATVSDFGKFVLLAGPAFIIPGVTQ